MRILGIDTGTPATAVALCEVAPRSPEAGGGGAANLRAAPPESTLEARDDPAPGSRPRHTTRLLELIQEVLDGRGWAEVDRIAVGLGPGTFTGLRVGIATARALALARSIPLVGVGTLDALALGARRDTFAGPVMAVLDARRGEAFAAAWREDGTLATPAAALAPEALGRLAASLEAPLAAGDGAVKFREVLERAGARVPGDGDRVHRVTAVAHCWLAAARAPGAARMVRPLYLREPDAKPPMPARAP